MSRSVDHEPPRVEAGLDPTTTRDRANTGGQLTHGERLHDVVVGAQFEPDDPVGLVAARGRDDDRHITGASKFAQYLEHEVGNL